MILAGWPLPEKPRDRDEANDCDHSAFYAADTNPWRPLEECPTCRVVLRTITDAQGWADHWAEQRSEQRSYDLGLLVAREESR